MKEKREKCITCEREKLFEEEGRYIDGSWAEDYLIFTQYGERTWRKWVCSYKCYHSLIFKSHKEVRNEKERRDY